jgi:hypothetical protein
MDVTMNNIHVGYLQEHGSVVLIPDPVGPLHNLSLDADDGDEVWIGEKPLRIETWHEVDYVGDSYKLIPTGRIGTTLVTCSLQYYHLREPIAEVVARFGWKTDLPQAEE